jgi:hypothetical protein
MAKAEEILKQQENRISMLIAEIERVNQQILFH